MEDRQKVTFTVRITLEQKSKLRAMAAAAGMSMAEFVRRALLDEDASLLVGELERQLKALGTEKVLDEMERQRKVLEAQDAAAHLSTFETASGIKSRNNLH